MNITLIGTGHVATVFGRMFQKAGFHITQVYGRNEAAAKSLASELHAETCRSLDELTLDADLYLVAVTDRALYELPRLLHVKNKLVVHTAGSVSMDVLQQSSDHYGVIYPLQSLRKEIKIVSEVPLLVDGNSEGSKKLLYDCCKQITGLVRFSSDIERMKFHLAAVFLNNFTNHLYTLGETFCEEEHLDFNMLHPLIMETANRIMTASPKQVITGPASRNDTITIDKHLELLKAYPRLFSFYEYFTNSIQETIKNSKNGTDTSI